MSQPLAEFAFEAEIFDWRGPSPFFFVGVPEPHAAALAGLARQVTYGWGMIPVEATIGGTTFRTSLFPKNGGYLLPIKVVVRRRESVTAGDVVKISLRVAEPG